jgi:hypothetical protein
MVTVNVPGPDIGVPGLYATPPAPAPPPAYLEGDCPPAPPPPPATTITSTVSLKLPGVAKVPELVKV